MPASTFDPALGAALTVITLAPVTITAVTGALTTGTPVDLEAIIAGLENTLEVITEDIRPLWDPQINEVPISNGESPRIICMKKSGSADLLQQTIRANASRRFLIAWTFGTHQQSTYAVFRRFRDGMTERGENTTEAEFGPMSAGTTAQTTVAVP